MHKVYFTSMYAIIIIIFTLEIAYENVFKARSYADLYAQLIIC